jgi:hypothetical protein
MVLLIIVEIVVSLKSIHLIQTMKEAINHGSYF